MAKIIIGIHGLGNKPPKDILEKWWLQAICEGLSNINCFHFEPSFELVYWADIINDKPLNPLITDPENPYYLDEPYTKSPETVDPEKHETRQRFLGFLEEQMDKILLNEDLSSNFNFISDLVFKKYFKELDIYYATEPEESTGSTKSLKDIIRDRLVAVLEKHKGKEIILIAHSMGTIIAYDVCNFVTPEIKIDTLVTLGSPLGIPIIVSKIADEYKKHNPEIKKLTTPANIQKNWFNYADIEDNVALHSKLAEDYGENLHGVKVNDTEIQNNYMINGERNPHKSYGYLRAPEVSNILAEFLIRDQSKIKLWCLRNFFSIRQYFKSINFLIKGKINE